MKSIHGKCFFLIIGIKMFRISGDFIELRIIIKFLIWRAYNYFNGTFYHIILMVHFVILF